MSYSDSDSSPQFKSVCELCHEIVTYGDGYTIHLKSKHFVERNFDIFQEAMFQQNFFYMKKEKCTPQKMTSPSPPPTIQIDDDDDDDEEMETRNIEESSEHCRRLFQNDDDDDDEKTDEASSSDYYNSNDDYDPLDWMLNYEGEEDSTSNKISVPDDISKISDSHLIQMDLKSLNKMLKKKLKKGKITKVSIYWFLNSLVLFIYSCISIYRNKLHS